MKNYCYHFFIWCAGSDTNILDECSHSERVKHAGYGVLICIPAILAFVSMSYAISTLTDNYFFIILSGLIMSGIIFSIDRFILSTFRKGETIKEDLFSRSFILRLIMASILGFALSHPFVLFYFDDSINQALKEDLLLSVKEKDSVSKIERNELVVSNKERIEVFRTDRSDVQTRITNRNQQIIDKQALIDCKRRLLTAEQSGAKISLPCGESSGKLRYGPRTKAIQDQINILINELDALKQESQSILNVLNAEIIRSDSLRTLTEFQNNKKLREFDSLQRIEIEELKNNFSNDYLAKENALYGKLAEKNPSTVWITSLFIILVFFIIDVVAVMLKVLVKRGSYDDKLDELHLQSSSSWFRLKNMETMKRNAEKQYYAQYAHDIYKEQLFVEEKAKQREKMISLLLDSAQKFNKKLCKDHQKFADFYFDNLEKINKRNNVDEEIQKEDKEMLNDVKFIFYKNSKEAREQFKK
ncbi:DUF4407 domain-containing protein [uncultured Kordia sp.]|uniref:DUF4407 domain-containing protein n=1 Tax=uncultured Kordia sp. TaxID=507699 RepID=UPI00262D1817|nr:DUF4407 domain-containing protein [uncultured Kordia sp.]